MSNTEFDPSRDRFLITIGYKSGASVTAWFYKFTAEMKNGELVSAEWECADQKVQPIFLAVDNIEYVFQNEAVEGKS